MVRCLRHKSPYTWTKVAVICIALYLMLAVSMHGGNWVLLQGSGLDEDVINTLSALNPNNATIGVVLQVFTRNSLALQLEFARKQTLKPRTIIVFQNGFKIDVSKIIQNFREKNPDIDVQHIASSKNYRFHGRFFITQLMTEDYVSIWDDDIEVRSDFLRYCVEYSYNNKHALVGRIGITFQKIKPNFDFVQLINVTGKNDMIGHTWTLPRVLLQYYIQMKTLTFHTGEDIQISYALQRVGIDSVVPPQSGEKLAITIKRFHTDKSAHFWWKRSPRYLLFCKLFRLGFKTVQCTNCEDNDMIESCIKKYSIGSDKIEQDAIEMDKIENKKVAFVNVKK